jgi:hypothetical protein
MISLGYVVRRCYVKASVCTSRWRGRENEVYAIMEGCMCGLTASMSSPDSKARNVGLPHVGETVLGCEVLVSY